MSEGRRRGERGIFRQALQVKTSCFHISGVIGKLHQEGRGVGKIDLPCFDALRVNFGKKRQLMGGEGRAVILRGAGKTRI